QPTTAHYDHAAHLPTCPPSTRHTHLPYTTLFRSVQARDARERGACRVSSSAGPISTLILAFDGVNLLDISGPLQVFCASEPHREDRKSTRLNSSHVKT